MVWDEETISLLREFWTQGLSTAEIGRRLGATKNAIVGKAHRLELEARPSPIHRAVAKPSADPFPRMAGPTLPPLPSAVADLRPMPIEEPSYAAGPACGKDECGSGVGRIGTAAEAPRPGDVRLVRASGAGDTPSPVAMPAAPIPALRPAVPPPRPAISPAAMPMRRSAPSCCWPIGEPGTKAFRFCDDVSVPGKPYCDEHAKLAYVKIRDRRDDAA